MSLNTNQDIFSGSDLSNNDKYTSFAQVLQTVSSDELDYLVPENGPAVLWRLVCQSKLNNPMSLKPDERDYCTLKHNRWQLVQMFHQINKADDLPLNVRRDSLQLMTCKDIGRWRSEKFIRAKPIMTNEQTRQAISRHNSWLELTIGARGIVWLIDRIN
ncbi:hypothetical protein PPACK8108_LOCUS19967 [Phakopsora pachyrhizi]|uniref:Uncharacterized protein n=1 Tax=Phakopsora pachyrhizi TaxID=170000 RepID=A0AAV0BE93_PHAPC|nr:hypothetical protein PPACK8108_LOCUS19967 [Phakopsora pachyrhizi]